VAPLDDDYPLALFSHELAHVIHRPADADEERWVDESLGEASMLANGYNIDGMWLTAYTNDPNFDWGPGGAQNLHYGGALVWGAYWLEKGGAPLLRAIVDEPGNGWPGLESAFANAGESGAVGHYHRALLSMYFDAPTLGFGFDTLETSVTPVATLTGGMSHEGTLAPYGAEFIVLQSNATFPLSVTPSDGTVTVLAASHSANNISVTDVSAGGTVTLGEMGAVLLVTSTTSQPYTIASP
jgi:hypothetical protein